MKRLAQTSFSAGVGHQDAPVWRWATIYASNEREALVLHGR
jgi:hypothetical protein